MARIEFYIDGNDHMETAVTDGVVPREGELISIRKVTYRIIGVTWAVDYAELRSQRQLRACVVLKPLVTRRIKRDVPES